MKEIKNFTKNNLDRELQKSFALSLKKDEHFVKLVNSLKIEEAILIKYTSELERTSKELKNCKTCSSLNECKNRMCGYVYYPEKEEERLTFSYIPCKYKKNENTNISYFEVPKSLKEAKMSDIYKDDKGRIEVIKNMKEFISKFKETEKVKGIYLHGSFGSGKSYLLSALINELTKKDKKAVIVYYPTLLKSLKASFNDEFKNMINEITETDLLLIDDIGAEKNTEWGRDEILGTILQYRMDNNLPTFFTSNLTIEELEEHFCITKESTDRVKARRIIERIKFLSTPISLTGENRRN